MALWGASIRRRASLRACSLSGRKACRHTLTITSSARGVVAGSWRRPIEAPRTQGAAQPGWPRARGLWVFPGVFRTLDELTEILPLAQPRKLECPIPVILYGTSYWTEIINFDALVRHGMIDREDLELFQYADDPATALGLLQSRLLPEADEVTPGFTHSRTQSSRTA